MPIYEYRCSKCDKIREEFVSIKQAEEKVMCECGAPAYRIISPTNFRLIGEGWDKPAAKDPSPKPAGGMG
jgi:putative FmdB family regulatory protein